MKQLFTILTLLLGLYISQANVSGALATLDFSTDTSVDWTASADTNTTTYCETEVTHFNIAGHAGSILLTVENSGDDSITVTATSKDNVIDLLDISNISDGGTTTGATIANGVATAVITWATGTMPATTSFTLLWSDEASGGNQMVNAGTADDALGNIDTSNVCSSTGGGDTGGGDSDGGDSDGGDSDGGDTTPNTTTYCETEVTHFNIANHPGSILLTVENSGDDSMTVTATSVNDVIDVLLIQNVEGGGTASATTITNGVATAEITWATGTMPATTSFTLLWSDEASGGNQMVNAGTADDALGNIDTSNVCSSTGGGDTGGGDTTPSGPSTAAPTPPARNAADVISLYSDAYTNVSSNFDAGWCGANSVSEISVAGNATTAFLGNNCQGIVLDAGIDASAFTNLHVDIYIEAGTDLTSSVFNLKFVNQPGGAALEMNLNVASSPALVAGQWLSVDLTVDLTNYTGFKEFGITSNLNNKVWYDNLYAYKGTPLGINEVNSFSVVTYPNPVENTLNVSAGISVDSVSIFDITGREVLRATPNATAFSLDVADLNKGLYLVSLKAGDQEMTTKLVK